MSNFSSIRFSIQEQQELLSLVNDLDLIPESLCTPTILRQYHQELCEKNGMSVRELLEHDQSIEFCRLFHQRNKIERNGDDLMSGVQGEFEFHNFDE